MFIEFMIQNQFFSYSLEEFAQILDIPCKGACVFTDKWSLDELAYGVPTDGPYQTNPPSPDDIISSIRIDQEGQVSRIRHEEEINVLEYQILYVVKLCQRYLALKPLEKSTRKTFLTGMIHDEIELITKGKNRKFLSVQDLQKIRKTAKLPFWTILSSDPAKLPA
ncbi:hypothetical protein Tco_0793105 [Tanacetum coccineum]